MKKTWKRLHHSQSSCKCFLKCGMSAANTCTVRVCAKCWLCRAMMLIGDTKQTKARWSSWKWSSWKWSSWTWTDQTEAIWPWASLCNCETVENSAQAWKLRYYSSYVANINPTLTHVRYTYTKLITYTRGRQLQHPENVNRKDYHFDCSSEEKTLFQYISYHWGVLDQSLVQNQLGWQQ